MFGTILTAIVTLFHLYVFWRAQSIEPLRRRLPGHRHLWAPGEILQVALHASP